MGSGEGKGWARGRSAADDPRIARNAAAHTGLIYTRRTPPEQLRWPVRSSRTLPLEWSDAMAYLVGLVATDGCLVSGRRQINFKSKDRELVELFLALLGRTNSVVVQATRTGGLCYHTQFGDAAWYEWLRAVGLSPRKSLVLGAISVPSAHLVPLLRGLLDGDGTIYVLVHHPTPRTYPAYRYERLWTRFTSASRVHLEWIERRVTEVLGLDGYLREEPLRERRHPFFTLKYGNRASVKLLSALYADPDAPCLGRKRAIWLDYAARHKLDAVKLMPSPT